jgi:hypothetical protein
MTFTTIPASARGRAVETRLAFEATAGVIAATGWKKARFYDLTAGMERPLVKDDQLGVGLANGRDPTKQRQGLPGGSLRRVAPINLTEAGYWLSAGFSRAAPTGADGDYVHVFTSGGDPAQTLSLAQKYATGDVTTDIGVALAELGISAAKTDQTARFTMTLIGLGEVEGSDWPQPTVAAAAADESFQDWRWRALWEDVAIGSALNLDINMNRGVERVNGLDGDEFPSFHHFGEGASTGTLKIYGRGDVFRDLGRSGETGKLTLEATDPLDPDNRYFRIEQHGVQFSKPQNLVQGGGQMSADFSYAASQDADNHAVVITLGNGVAAY